MVLRWLSNFAVTLTEILNNSIHFMKFVAVSRTCNREENLPICFALLKQKEKARALSSANTNPNIVSIGMRHTIIKRYLIF